MDKNIKSQETYRQELEPLIKAALYSPGLLSPNAFQLARYSLNQFTRNRLLDPDMGALEDYLIDFCGMPGDSLAPSNMNLLNAFGDVVHDICYSDSISLSIGYQRMSWLLIWLNLRHPPGFFGEDPDSPLQILQMTAASGIGEWAAAFNQIEVGIDILLEQAGSPLWRVRGAAVSGLQRMLKYAWKSTFRRFQYQAMMSNGREWAVMMNALSDKALLDEKPARALQVLGLQDQAMLYVLELKEADKQKSGIQALINGMKKNPAAVIQIFPVMGLAQLAAWATWPDETIKAIVRENLKGLTLASDEVTRIHQILRQ